MTSQALQTALIPPRKGRRLVHALQAAVRKTKLELNVAYPCEVTAFDPTTQLVNVVVDFSHVLSSDDVEQPLEPETLENILVSFEGQARPSGGYLTFPIAAGDKGYVTVFDRSVDRWIDTGIGGDPQLRHTHSRIDGVFKPLRDLTRSIPSFDEAAAVLEHSCIKLGMGATEAAVLGDIMKAWADSFVTWASTHTHTYSPGPSPPAPTTPPLSSPPSTTSFLSSKVKIDV